MTIDRHLRGPEELRLALAMLKAISVNDLEAVMILDKHADRSLVQTALFRLVIDALCEPATADLERYIDQAFERLDSS